MKKIFLITVLILAGVFSIIPVGAVRPAEAGGIKGIVLYIPNRIFDMLDIVRLRLRVGPGLSAGVSNYILWCANIRKIHVYCL